MRSAENDKLVLSYGFVKKSTKSVYRKEID